MSELIDGLRAGLALPGWCEPPMHLGTGKRAGDVMMFQNGLIDLATGAKVEASPKLWIHSGVRYDWNPGAQCPGWLAFLASIFPGDRDAQDCVDEWVGYNTTEDVRLQKGALFKGDPRSGKGTILKIIEALIGGTAYCSMDIDTWMATPFAGEVMIGKKAIAFADVRLKEPKWYGQNFDAGGIPYQSVQRMLKISAGDKITLGRKYNPIPWEGVLPGKISLASNEVPNFNDPVLPTRFLKLAFNVSFLGREDVTLADRLIATELPGIAARCLRAYHRARDRGRIIQPASGAKLELEVVKTSDPFAQFVMKTFTPDAGGSVIIGEAYNKLASWCHNHGMAQLLQKITRQNMRGKLRNIRGFHSVSLGSRAHGEPRRWSGLRWRNNEDRRKEQEQEE